MRIPKFKRFGIYLLIGKKRIILIFDRVIAFSGVSRVTEFMEFLVSFKILKHSRFTHRKPILGKF